ncbi:FAD-dependent oxidoreductase [Moorella sp. Hama-1]|uniref:FAD-dependent oxidoreductase n=1 Tax=Moorella sp. Hama-1 TaxID=2138101 RepID=UPI000D643805|nr:hypothetical protein hamaS1_21380 [Moorella sp. Hama-1]
MWVKKFELVVLGGGTAGLTIAEEAATHGWEVALLEERALGGTCVNVGRILVKTLPFGQGHALYPPSRSPGAGRREQPSSSRRSSMLTLNTVCWRNLSVLCAWYQQKLSSTADTSAIAAVFWCASGPRLKAGWLSSKTSRS